MFDETVFNRISMQLAELNVNIKSLQKTIERNSRNGGIKINTNSPFGPIDLSEYNIGLPIITGVAAVGEDDALSAYLTEPTEPVDKQGGLQGSPWPFPTGTTAFIDKSGKWF